MWMPIAFAHMPVPMPTPTHPSPRPLSTPVQEYCYSPSPSPLFVFFLPFFSSKNLSVRCVTTSPRFFFFPFLYVVSPLDSLVAPRKDTRS
jgi:hypothetical protein